MRRRLTGTARPRKTTPAIVIKGTSRFGKGCDFARILAAFYRVVPALFRSYLARSSLISRSLFSSSIYADSTAGSVKVKRGPPKVRHFPRCFLGFPRFCLLLSLIFVLFLLRCGRSTERMKRNDGSKKEEWKEMMEAKKKSEAE